jgi:hypothetical protein
MMTVPAAEAPDAYAMVEHAPVRSDRPLLDETEEDQVATFSARPEFQAERPRRKKSLKTKLIRQAKEEASDFAAILAATWKWLLGIPLIAAVVLWVIVAFVPNGALIAASVLALVGSVMIITGFVIGARGAFHEDFLNGMLYVFIPFYTAYFIATNWDAMWRWFLLMTAGSGLIMLAAKIALPSLERMEKAGAGQSRVVVPAKSMRLAYSPRMGGLVAPNLVNWGV